jgi:hypothetical protein
LDTADFFLCDIDRRSVLNAPEVDGIEDFEQCRSLAQPDWVPVEHCAQGFDHASRQRPRFIVGRPRHALQSRNQRRLAILLEASGNCASRHRLPRPLFIDGNRIAQKFDISAGTHVRDLEGQGLVSDQSGRMECHLGNRGGGGIDRLESSSLLFLGRYHDLAWHAFDAEDGRVSLLSASTSRLDKSSNISSSGSFLLSSRRAPATQG